ncbi:alpha-crystallin A chain-like [Battus philenor]|uniref:alpha-crystallin A chain-like n=1 Tax=Battus philenor TaxID=42288 RepID=UPI0035D056AC
MFSPRVLAAFALLAAVAALPVSDKPSFPQPITTVNDDEVDDFTSWFRGPWDSLFSSVWKLIPSFADIGPRIVAKENEFQVIVNVKKYKREDLSVKIKGDFMFVQGIHEAKHDDSDLFASQFFHTYSLPVNASASDVEAQLFSDGYLVVTAPLNGASEKGPVERDVPITEMGKPYNKDEKPEEKPAEPTPTAPPEEEKKEQTTPSEDTTEKDNVIPHGNEVQP